MPFKLKTVALFVALTFLTTTCQINFGKKGIKEGTVKYKITYLQSEKDNPIVSLMPSYLNMSFKDNSVRMDVEGWMGIFKSTFIRQYSLGQSVNLLKMMNKKYYYICSGSDDFMGMQSYTDVSITFDDTEKEILDFTCQHARVSANSGSVNFDLYYTTEIDISEPNNQSPFKEIPGVLMEFQIEINGISMFLEAAEVVEAEISDELFQIPAGFEEVPKKTIDDIFSSLI